jgi:hypothetical protein
MSTLSMQGLKSKAARTLPRSRGSLAPSKKHQLRFRCAALAVHSCCGRFYALAQGVFLRDAP